MNNHIDTMDNKTIDDEEKKAKMREYKRNYARQYRLLHPEYKEKQRQYANNRYANDEEYRKNNHASKSLWRYHNKIVA